MLLVRWYRCFYNHNIDLLMSSLTPRILSPLLAKKKTGSAMNRSFVFNYQVVSKIL